MVIEPSIDGLRPSLGFLGEGVEGFGHTSEALCHLGVYLGDAAIESIHPFAQRIHPLIELVHPLVNTSFGLAYATVDKLL